MKSAVTNEHQNQTIHFNYIIYKLCYASKCLMNVLHNLLLMLKKRTTIIDSVFIASVIFNPHLNKIYV